MGDGQFKYSLISSKSSSALRAAPTITLILVIGVVILFVTLLWLSRRGSSGLPSQVSGSAAVSADQLSTDGALNVQSQLNDSQTSSDSATDSNSSASISQNSASVSVDGQTFTVSGEGTVNKTVQTSDGTANVNISVQKNQTNVSASTKSRTHSSSTLRVNSNSSIQEGQ
jgi:cytoskeletal protein RodZ